MTRFCSASFALIGVLLLGGIHASELRAETWTDRTGKFKIEADYVGVQGTSVVLRKADGSTVNVPIDRLSDASRDRAKQLYQAAKTRNMSETSPRIESEAAVANPDANIEPTSPASPTINPLMGATAPTQFTPPVPPAVDPMPAFLEDASLQDTVDFVRVQMLSGHPEVLWYALPSDFRQSLDSSEFRAQVIPQIQQQQSSANDAIQKILMKVIEVLVTKKNFVLGSQPLALRRRRRDS